MVHVNSAPETVSEQLSLGHQKFEHSTSLITPHFQNWSTLSARKMNPYEFISYTSWFVSNRRSRAAFRSLKPSLITCLKSTNKEHDLFGRYIDIRTQYEFKKALINTLLISKTGFSFSSAQRCRRPSPIPV